MHTPTKQLYKYVVLKAAKAMGCLWKMLLLARWLWQRQLWSRRLGMGRVTSSIQMQRRLSDMMIWLPTGSFYWKDRMGNIRSEGMKNVSACYWFQGAADSKQEAKCRKVPFLHSGYGRDEDWLSNTTLKCPHDNEIFGTLVQFSRLLLNCVWFTWNLPSMWIHHMILLLAVRDDVAQSMAVGVAIAWRQFTLPQKTLKFSQIQKRDRNLIMASQLPLLRRVPMGIFLALLMPRRSGEGPG